MYLHAFMRLIPQVAFTLSREEACTRVELPVRFVRPHCKTVRLRLGRHALKESKKRYQIGTC
jgi:hypothetical protein